MDVSNQDVAIDARCAQHVDHRASGICARCGSYHCEACVKDLGGKRLCTLCLAIPGIDYLAETRAKRWGKRDAWIWYLGLLGGLGSTTAGLTSLATGEILQAAGSLAAATLMVSYFFMLPWSRNALFLAIPISVGNSALRAPAAEVPAYMGLAIISALIMGLFVLAAHASTRNKLAFKLAVSDRELADYYDKYVSNPDAQRALGYGAISLMMPVLIPVALVFGVRALRRFKPDAWPPVRHRSAAVTGLVCAGLAVLFWSVIAVIAVTR